MTASSDRPFRIVFALYPGVTQLDFTGPHQFLVRLPNTELVVASMTGEPITSDGLTFSGLGRLVEIDRCDLICVPGGLGATQMINDEAFLAQVRRLAAGARYVTSVCTGSLILGAAGLLRGKRAACHWAWRDMLPAFGAIPDDGRVVRDGDVITGGGVTAGIDFALVVAEELAGRDMAEMIQLGLEYAPAPPFNSGRPETARPSVLEAFARRMNSLGGQRREDVARAAAAMEPQPAG